MPMVAVSVIAWQLLLYMIISIRATINHSSIFWGDLWGRKIPCNVLGGSLTWSLTGPHYETVLQWKWSNYRMSQNVQDPASWVITSIDHTATTSAPKTGGGWTGMCRMGESTRAQYLVAEAVKATYLFGLCQTLRFDQGLALWGETIWTRKPSFV